MLFIIVLLILSAAVLKDAVEAFLSIFAADQTDLDSIPSHPGGTANDLLPIAHEFVRLVQSTDEALPKPGLDKASLAIIGGVAVIFHRGYRQTRDIDFAISPSKLGPQIKQALVQTHPTRCAFYADMFKFLAEDGWVQIDLVPEVKLPCLPSNMAPIRTMNPTQVPVADPLTLGVQKAFSCQARGTSHGSAKDAEDVWYMLTSIPDQAYLASLTPSQREVLSEAAGALQEHSTRDWAGLLP
ncbi:hypothetical protein BDW74DRAFT_174119 [Aspergillus multicolor]|uniref:uncharacterized protein n=1 Tax=Aspergillus multicolor TaxID=41759 RepID=UPI003CCDA4FE